MINPQGINGVLGKRWCSKRRKRTRKAVVSSSKMKDGYPKEWIMFAGNIPWDPSRAKTSGRIRMTRNILADKWYPLLFLHRIAVPVEILRPETLVRKFFRLYYNIETWQNKFCRLLPLPCALSSPNRRFCWNIALGIPCKQVSSLILYHKLLKKSVTFLVAFGCVL